jgi:DNA-binding GntR family transcriptional regulator
MQELLALYRFALRSGDRPLAEALARAMRSDPFLRRQADTHLQLLPRGEARWSEAAERAVTAALRGIDSIPR